MKPLILSMALAATALPAHALSCLPPDVARTFNRAAEAEDTYIVVHGTLTFDTSKLPQADWQNQQNKPPNTLIPARLTGQSMSKAGFKTPFDSAITLNAQCLGLWCAGAKSGTPYLAFLERGTQGYTLVLGPCGGLGFADPTPEMLRKALQCFRGSPCKPAPLN